MRNHAVLSPDPTPHPLSRIPLFSQLDGAELAQIAAAGTRRTVAAQERIFTQGDRGDALYVILEGAVRVHLTGADGLEVELSTLDAGEVFGSLALLEDQPRSASVTAIAPSSLLVLERRRVPRPGVHPVADAGPVGGHGGCAAAGGQPAADPIGAAATGSPRSPRPAPREGAGGG